MKQIFTSFDLHFTSNGAPHPRYKVTWSYCSKHTSRTARGSVAIHDGAVQKLKGGRRFMGRGIIDSAACLRAAWWMPALHKLLAVWRCRLTEQMHSQVGSPTCAAELRTSSTPRTLAEAILQPDAPVQSGCTNNAPPRPSPVPPPVTLLSVTSAPYT